MVSLVCDKYPDFPTLNKAEKAVFLLDNPDVQVLSHVGRVAHEIMTTFTNIRSATHWEKEKENELLDSCIFL